MNSLIRQILCGVGFALGAALPVFSQQTSDAPADNPAENEKMAAFVKVIKSIDWVTEGKGSLGDVATLNVPAGYRFTASAGAIRMMEAYGNLTNGMELGYVSPIAMEWFTVFEFEKCGYVKDDEKDQLDSNKILEQLKKSQRESNKELAKRGMPTLEVLGWQTPPFYNPKTNNLEWAIRLRSQNGRENVNYKTKLLGRRGVMDVVLVCDEKEMASVVPEYQKLLAGFSFKKEESYAAFTKGDAVAKYGLTGLIVGGGLLVAAKSGLLAKLWKFIIVGIAAIGAFLKRIFVGKTKETN